MKKTKVIALLLLAFLAISLFAGCAKAIDIYEMRSNLISKGFEVKIEDDADEDIGVVLAFRASNGAYKIEFAQFDTEESASSYFGTLKTKATTEITDGAFEVTTGKSSESLSFVHGEKFYCYSRQGNIIIVTKCDVKYRAAVTEIFEDLGFKA